LGFNRVGAHRASTAAKGTFGTGAAIPGNDRQGEGVGKRKAGGRFFAMVPGLPFNDVDEVVAWSMMDMVWELLVLNELPACGSKYGGVVSRKFNAGSGGVV